MDLFILVISFFVDTDYPPNVLRFLNLESASKPVETSPDMTYARTGVVGASNDGVNCVPAGCCPTGIKLFVGVWIFGFDIVPPPPPPPGTVVRIFLA
jgi:hypothetical protein